MADKAWKSAERRIADKIGGKRIPITGRGDLPDIEHNWLAPEVKYRLSLPRWLFNARKQSEQGARPNQMPVQIYIQKNMDADDAFIVARLRDFVGRFL